MLPCLVEIVKTVPQCTSLLLLFFPLCAFSTPGTCLYVTVAFDSMYINVEEQPQRNMTEHVARMIFEVLCPWLSNRHLYIQQV